LHVTRPAQLVVFDFDVVKALTQVDHALAVFGAVRAAVIDHQLAIDRDQRAIVRTGAEDVGSGGGGGDLAHPTDGERFAQGVVGQDEEVALDQAGRARPVGAGVVVAD